MSSSIYKALSKTPNILLHCDSDTCQGTRTFEPVSGKFHAREEEWNFEFLYYRCRNCHQRTKRFAVAARWQGRSTGEALKLGEIPTFGPHTPPRVISLIGPDKDLFLKGRRAENRGLGIGAFAYYRRVVENQKGRIIKQIAKAAQKLGSNPEVLKRFAAAATETQFSKAIDEIKDGVPDMLLIDGHNPLTLLHSALSDGLHERSDEECLEIATEIRLVLTELAERLSQALKEEAELKKAVTRLLNRKTKETAPAARDSSTE